MITNLLSAFKRPNSAPSVGLACFIVFILTSPASSVRLAQRAAHADSPRDVGKRAYPSRDAYSQGSAEPALAQAGGTNWLSNPDFEQNVWYFQDGIQEIKIPAEWWAYWRESPPQGLALPNNCPDASDTGCYWQRPEFKPVEALLYPYRVHGGSFAAGYFSFGRMHEAGFYQHVDRVPAGYTARFSIWMMAWMCSSPDACDGGKRSDAPARMHLQIGIDPTGGWDPWSPDVVWSPDREAFDAWTQFQVEAQVREGLGGVTVFTRSRAEWDWPRRNNDVYVDDGRLEVFAPEIPMPTRGPQSPPGFITHTVVSGETVLLIAARYGARPEQIVQANGLPPNARLVPGQILWVPAEKQLTGTAIANPTPFPLAATWPVATRTPGETSSAIGYAKRGEPDVAGVAVAFVAAVAVFAAAIAAIRWLNRRR